MKPLNWLNRKELNINPSHFSTKCAQTLFLAYLRVSLEVSLEKRLLVPRLRVWDRGVASWERVGEAGGPLYVAVRRSLSWPPWKVLRLAVPRGKRRRSGVVVLATLWVDATGFLWLPGDTATLLKWTEGEVTIKAGFTLRFSRADVYFNTLNISTYLCR